MNAGVSTSPCGVVITPQRVRPSVCVTRKEKGDADIVERTVYNFKSRGQTTRRRDLRRSIGRTRSVAGLGGQRVQESRPRSLRGDPDQNREGRPLDAAPPAAAPR